MQLWKIILAYDGTAFHGWQIQPQLPTVQGSLRSALREITGEEVLPQGSGRTDTGVHALGQVASFSLESRIPPANLLRALNRILPAAIRILSAEHAEPGFHARHSAKRKTYEYRIFPRVPNGSQEDTRGHSSETSASPSRASRSFPDRICSPFLAPYIWDCPWPFDLRLANAAAAQIVGTHNFRSFAASDPDLQNRTPSPNPSPSSTVRTIYASHWTCEDSLFIYRVTGSGFLHHMVRNLVGTFVDVAAGRIPVEAVGTILAACNRAAAGQTAPARGLFLVTVEYGGTSTASSLDPATCEGATSNPEVQP